MGDVTIDRLDRVRPIFFVPREIDPSSRPSLAIVEIRAESERVQVLGLTQYHLCLTMRFSLLLRPCSTGGSFDNCILIISPVVLMVDSFS